MTGPIDATVSALADPTRRRVIELLCDNPRPASQLAEATKTSRPAMSRNLRILRKSRLVEERTGFRDARQRIDSLSPDAFAELRGWVEHVRAFWTEQLQAFKAHVDV